ncbi:MAG TPA: tRNA (N6-isopentenyl adenosine(37)-C2)-methylthiotransferase MiaB [Bacteroidota bacterium]|nr:tRNA (N6-isopentenyl adenosine(37)-C2)-methylthiotransferase MiaB [Bacteroidota bacterium]
MNIADTEVVHSVLGKSGYEPSPTLADADVVLVNTCSVRENAEQRIYGRLGEFKRLKEENPDVVVGVIGCMAERLRSKLTDDFARGVGQIVDIIVGPDEYRKMPVLLDNAWHGEKGIAVQLSRSETYDDIVPLRTSGVSAWISVMRGCDKFCTFCVVPFTRGRERSRTLAGVVHEVELLASRNFKEITLLGQNVNSYRDGDHDFPDLLRAVARVDRSIRVRFTTSHPQDFSDKLIEAIASEPNICKFIHLPIQSGSDRILGLMNRTYSRDHYLHLVEKIRRNIPAATLSTDIIAGFPTETEADHSATLDVLRDVRYDGAFMFKYSPRENTPAFTMNDDVPDQIKSRRVTEIIELQNSISTDKNRTLVGSTVTVLVEGESKKSSDQWHGRTDGNKMVIFDKGGTVPGEYVDVCIGRSNSATLFGSIVQHSTSVEAA